jgi:hypothetical protein
VFVTHGNVSDEGLAGAAIGVAAPTKAIISLREKEFCEPNGRSLSDLTAITSRLECGV